MIDYRRLHPELYEAMHHLQAQIDDTGLEPGLRECRRAGLTPPLKPSPGTESDITRAFVRG